MSYSCWVLDEEQRVDLLERFSPAFPDVIAHHVTLKNPSKIAPDEAVISIVGRIMDPTGVEALVVTVETGGEQATTRRQDGNFYHLTWSIDRAAGKKPFSSVEACERLMLTDHYQLVDPPIVLKTSPEVCG